MKRHRVEKWFDLSNRETRELILRVTCYRHRSVPFEIFRHGGSSVREQEGMRRPERERESRSCQTKARATASVQVLSIIECTRYRDKGLVTRS